MRSEERSGWIVGLILIAMGGLFLLQNLGIAVFVGNWWALFILIPAIAGFSAAWMRYQQDRQFTPTVLGLIAGSLVPLTIALIFLFNFSFGNLWPVLLVVLGVGMLLRSLGKGDDRSTVTPT